MNLFPLLGLALAVARSLDFRSCVRSVAIVFCPQAKTKFSDILALCFAFLLSTILHSFTSPTFLIARVILRSQESRSFHA